MKDEEELQYQLRREVNLKNAWSAAVAAMCQQERGSY
jgi:hypothetical protein